MQNTCTIVIQQNGDWRIGWSEESPARLTGIDLAALRRTRR